MKPTNHLRSHNPEFSAIPYGKHFITKEEAKWDWGRGDYKKMWRKKRVKKERQYNKKLCRSI